MCIIDYYFFMVITTIQYFHEKMKEYYPPERIIMIEIRIKALNFKVFYILIMDEKVLVLCEKCLLKISSNLYVLRPPESEKMVFTKVSVCLSVCL